MDHETNAKNDKISLRRLISNVAYIMKTICNDLQFVASWIYLYTMNWKKTMVTGITAYKRRSPNVL